MFGGNNNYIGFFVEDLNPDEQSHFFDFPNEYEVIGNIFENPQLLAT
jgi:hypothetical protein